MEDVCEGKDYSFPKQEEQILEFWDKIDAFETQLKLTENLPEYIFYDGPPFATGLPHYGHILTGTIKDIVTRYQTMTGHHVTRRFGWDCHGLPVEHEIDTKLGIKSKADVLAMGIDKYNEECWSIVTRYVETWEKIVKRTGRWIDFQNDYKTMDLKFMESICWVFAQLYDKGPVYIGFKVIPYSTGLKTPLSNFEANLNYKEVPDPDIMVSFPIVGDSHNVSLVAWTTTPWTLPSNLALCVNANFVYVKVRSKSTGATYVVAESRMLQLPKEKVKIESIPNGSVGEMKITKSKSKGSSADKTKTSVDDSSYELVEELLGSSLVGLKPSRSLSFLQQEESWSGDTLMSLRNVRSGTYDALMVFLTDWLIQRYIPLFEYFVEFSDVAFKVVAGNYVTDDCGTGVVHCAPAFGEDDCRVLHLDLLTLCRALTKIVAVDDDGCLTERITDFKGRYVKDADKDIINAIKQKGRLVKQGSFMHSYPFCWRSETPLIYRAVPAMKMHVLTPNFEKIKLKSGMCINLCDPMQLFH
ncbi:hypothetical protein Ancab_023424 [Ancistrocladus abbreviatus]